MLAPSFYGRRVGLSPGAAPTPLTWDNACDHIHKVGLPAYRDKVEST